MKTFKKLFIIFICLCMAASLCACGKAGSSSRSGSYYAGDLANYESEDYYAAPEVGMVSYSGSGNGLSAQKMAVNTASQASDSSAPMEAGNDGIEKTETSSDLNPEKIIYSSDVTVETTEFDATLTAIKAVIDNHGGWIESSSINGAKYSSISRGTKTDRTASYTIRVPNGEFQKMMDELPSLGNIPYSHVYTENVTAQYYDTQARLQTYQAQEKRLTELLDKAETVSDVIEIENELTDVRYRIESLQTALRGWDRRVSWSTIYLTVNEVREYTPAKERSYWQKLVDAMSDGIENLGDVFIGFIEALPVLLFWIAILAAFGLIVGKCVKRIKKKKKVKQEQTKETQ